MEFHKNISLKPHNTFGLDVKAAAFCEVNSLSQLKQALLENRLEHFMFLGGGSNVLFAKDYNGLIIKNNIKGIQVEHEDIESVYLKAYSGEVWHDLVVYCVNKGWGGIENLSLIPGTVGAAPMQNIGAYGVELENCFVELEAFNLRTLEFEKFNKQACAFGYRESVFKRQLKGQYFIYSVTLKLNKHPKTNIEYGDIKQILLDAGIQPENASIKEVSNAVIAIRSSKLPNPKELGNSGSFFKNPVISVDHFEQLKIRYPEIKGFPQSQGVKVPAAWLIEQCGWKGKRVGETGSHAKQALVLVNYGHAKGEEIYQLAMDIIKSVKEKFSITLEPEVNLIG
ncbi:MAG: UDP-N-acetylmuramate dehydrogenase [Bacteroidia bacterium]|nr:UDP-N-acetylmuramate dehydrogenase [Bacteroidia bacterium]